MAQKMRNSKRGLFFMSSEGAGNKGIKLAGNGCFSSLRHPALSCFETTVNKKSVASMKWKKAHPEKVKKQQRKYYLTHKKQARKRKIKWVLAHKEWIREYDKKRYPLIREKAIKTSREWRIKNAERVKIVKTQYRQSMEGKASTKKHNDRRKELGFFPLNKPFPKSTPHHIDKERVVYMPTEIHKSIPHSILQNFNMEKINAEAFKFLKSPGAPLFNFGR